MHVIIRHHGDVQFDLALGILGIPFRQHLLKVLPVQFYEGPVFHRNCIFPGSSFDDGVLPFRQV